MPPPITPLKIMPLPDTRVRGDVNFLWSGDQNMVRHLREIVTREWAGDEDGREYIQWAPQRPDTFPRAIGRSGVSAPTGGLRSPTVAGNMKTHTFP